MLRLENFLNGGIGATMEFDRVPIGISDGLPEGRRFGLGRYRASGCPGLQYSLVAVGMVVPSDRKYFESPARLPPWPGCREESL